LPPLAKKVRIEKRHCHSYEAKIREIKEKLCYLRLADTSVLQLYVQSAGASRAASHTTSANIAIRPEIILLRVSSLAPASHFLICTIQFQKLPLTNAGSIAGARISWQWNWLKKSSWVPLQHREYLLWYNFGMPDTRPISQYDRVPH
jgi:hypothetical protein